MKEKKDIKEKIKNIFKEDPAIKELGSYQKEVSENPEIEKISSLSEKEKKEKKKYLILAIVMLCFIPIPMLFKLLDPKYKERSPEYKARMAKITTLDHNKLECQNKIENGDIYTLNILYVGFYYNDKVYKSKTTYKYETKDFIYKEEPNLKTYLAIYEEHPPGANATQDANTFVINLDFLRYKTLKREKVIDDLGISLDTFKSKREDLGWTCKKINMGKIEVDKEVYNGL